MIAILIQSIAIGIPLILIAIYRKSLNPLYAIGLVLPLVFFNSAILYFFANHLPYSKDHLNVAGKIAQILWPLAIIFLFKLITPNEIGLKLPLYKPYLLWGIVIGSILAIVFFTIEKIWFMDLLPKHPISNIKLLYEFFLPSISEELVYRGIFLAILNKYFGRPWKFFNIQFGWGLIFVSM